VAVKKASQAVKSMPKKSLVKPPLVKKVSAKKLSVKKLLVKKTTGLVATKLLAKDSVKGAKVKQKPSPAKGKISKRQVARSPIASQKTSTKISQRTPSTMVPLKASLPRPILQPTLAQPPVKHIEVASEPIGTPIGTVTHYYPNLGVAVVNLTSGRLRIEDAIHIKGPITDFKQVIRSIEIDHKQMVEVNSVQLIGLKVIESVREHDLVYKVNRA